MEQLSLQKIGNLLQKCNQGNSGWIMLVGTLERLEKLTKEYVISKCYSERQENTTEIAKQIAVYTEGLKVTFNAIRLLHAEIDAIMSQEEKECREETEK